MCDLDYVPTTMGEILSNLGRPSKGSIGEFQIEWKRCARILREHPRAVYMCFMMATTTGKFGQQDHTKGGLGGHVMTGYPRAVFTGDVNCPNKVNILWLSPEERESKRRWLLRGLEKDGVSTDEATRFPSILMEIADNYFRKNNTIAQDLIRAKGSYTLADLGTKVKEVQYRLFLGKDRREVSPEELEAFLPSVHGVQRIEYVSIRDMEGVQFLNHDTGLALPSRYPLAWGEGCIAYRRQSCDGKKPVSFLKWCNNALHTRIDSSTRQVVFNPLTRMGLLSQQILCEMYAVYEQQKIVSASQFIKKFQNARSKSSRF